MPLLYAVALALGWLSSLHTAAATAAIPHLVEREALHRANAAFIAVITIAGATGAMLGTLLVAAAGPARAGGPRRVT